MPDLIDLIRSSPVIPSDLPHLLHSVASAPKDGLLLEFGVFKGRSINLIADAVYPRRVHGFDSFTGLPEPWLISERLTYKTGHFGIGPCLPDVRPNVTLVKGWFHEMIPAFLASTPGLAAFINIDSDIYKSAKTVLDLLNERIVPGTILYFDELCDKWSGQPFYQFWKDGEYKALVEWLYERGREVEPFSRNALQGASVRVTA